MQVTDSHNMVQIKRSVKEAVTMTPLQMKDILNVCNTISTKRTGVGVANMASVNTLVANAEKLMQILQPPVFVFIPLLGQTCAYLRSLLLRF